MGFSGWFDPVLTSGLNWVGFYPSNKGLVKGAILCFRNLYFYFRHGESTATASQLTSPASQKSKNLNKVLLLLQDLACNMAFILQLVSLDNFDQ